MSEDTQAKLAQQLEDDKQLRMLDFRAALSICEERNEFVDAYLAALAEKLEQMRPLYDSASVGSTVVVSWQCAAFLVACGKSNLPITDAIQTMREFVQFLDDSFVHWR
jgi:hypothetical protein